MQEGRAQDWAILGAGVRPYDANMRDRLLAQDCLTTLIELAPDSRSAEVTGAMTGYLPIEDGNGPLIRAMAEPRIRIVGLTVTEGGYFIDGATGGLDTRHPDIVHDAAHPDRPRTAFGAMVAALRLRRDAGQGPFSGLSCDNLRGNGAILRQTVVELARLSDPGLADWIDAEAAFPNSMVDSIVPATGPAELSLVREMGIDDAAPVTHENFRQWVIEDAFCAGRPDWDRAGATFTDDVHGYEMMKIRILNAGHQLLANAGEASVGSHHRRLHGPSGDRRNVPQGADRGDPALRRPRARNHAGGVSRACRTAFFPTLRSATRPAASPSTDRPVTSVSCCRSCARRLRQAVRWTGWPCRKPSGRACARGIARMAPLSSPTTQAGWL